MAQGPVFKSEVFVPIKKDDQSFEERQKNLWVDRQSNRPMWEDMHERMERRRQDWESEVERMRRDFFKLRAMGDEGRRDSSGSVGSGSGSTNLLERMDLSNIFVDDPEKGGGKKFHVSFDVSQFQPEEVSVLTQDDKVIVQAKHEEKSGSGSVSREFSRQVDIPKHVDKEQLQCTISKDGILQLEAPVPAPAYEKIRETAPKTPPADPAMSRNLQEYRMGPVMAEEDGSKKLKMVVDIGPEFKPEDIQVRTVDKKLMVTARHEEKSAGRTSVREFSREFDLPEDVDPNLVTASMTEDGKLCVEAPMHGPQQPAPQYTAQPQQQQIKQGPRVTVTLR